MGRVKLNIPSMFSHSKFVVKDKDIEKFSDVELLETDINFIYSLVYLYRDKILKSNPNCMEKETDDDENVFHISDDTKINFEEKHNIEFYSLYSVVYGENHNSSYELMDSFIEKFKDIYVETNLFGKDKKNLYKHIKLFEKLEKSSNGYGMDVIFNEEYIKPYIHTESLFKKVTLNILFQLSGKYSKLLYLLFKDYENVSFETNNKELSYFLGGKSVVSRVENYIKQINHKDV